MKVIMRKSSPGGNVAKKRNGGEKMAWKATYNLAKKAIEFGNEMKAAKIEEEGKAAPGNDVCEENGGVTGSQWSGKHANQMKAGEITAAAKWRRQWKINEENRKQSETAKWRNECWRMKYLYNNQAGNEESLWRWRNIAIQLLII